MSPQQIRNTLYSAKETQDISSQCGICRIYCSYDLFYFETTIRRIKTGLTAHKCRCQLDQLEKSAVSENALQEYHTSSRSNLMTPLFYGLYSIICLYRLYRAAVPIHKYRNDLFTTYGGLRVNRTVIEGVNLLFRKITFLII